MVVVVELTVMQVACYVDGLPHQLVQPSSSSFGLKHKKRQLYLPLSFLIL